MAATLPAVGLDSRYCNAKRRHGGHCTQRAGWGTDHVGYGPCKLHTGSTMTGHTKHGLRSRYAKAKLAPAIEALKATDPDPLNITEELALARAQLGAYLETHGELEGADIYYFSALLENVTKTVARIEKMRAENAISRQDLRRMVAYMTESMEAVVQDTAKETTIKQLWMRFRYGAGLREGA